jgi:predicted AAA+ superfamily ATPase
MQNRMVTDIMQYNRLNLHRLLLYRRLLDDKVIQDFSRLTTELDNKGGQEKFSREELYFSICYKLFEYSQLHNISGDVWQNYVLNLIVGDENIFSLSCEKRGHDISPSIYKLAMHDLLILKDLYNFDWAGLGEKLGAENIGVISSFQADNQVLNSYSVWYKNCLNKLKADFKEEAELDNLVQSLAQFYNTVGVGLLGRHIAFKWNHGLQAIAEFDPVQLSDLVGYQYQKTIITSNTEAFLAGRRANHILLYGNKGTGKSSMVKAMLNQYAKSGLRMLELSREQLVEFGQIMAALEERGYYFIIFIDDLSFEDFEVEYKHIKSVIEGSLEVTPGNVLIYVTSNRRHLIRENWSDRQVINQEVHAAETEQEKLSLVDRFGITLSFESPAQEQYLQIVTEIAQRNHLDMDYEELRRGALQWERKSHGRSGRTAQQYINHLLSLKQAKTKDSP